MQGTWGKNEELMTCIANSIRLRQCIQEKRPAKTHYCLCLSVHSIYVFANSCRPWWRKVHPSQCQNVVCYRLCSNLPPPLKCETGRGGPVVPQAAANPHTAGDRLECHAISTRCTNEPVDLLIPSVKSICLSMNQELGYFIKGLS